VETTETNAQGWASPASVNYGPALRSPVTKRNR